MTHGYRRVAMRDASLCSLPLLPPRTPGSPAHHPRLMQGSMCLSPWQPGNPGWAELPPDVLATILAVAHQQLCSPPCKGLPAGELDRPLAGVPQHSQLPTLAAVAALRLATEGCCRSWRAAAAGAPPPVAVLLGQSPLPPRPLRPLLAWLSAGAAGPRRIAALHFAASEAPGCRSGDMQRLALELLGSAEMADAGARLQWSR